MDPKKVAINHDNDLLFRTGLSDQNENVKSDAPANNYPINESDNPDEKIEYFTE